MLRTMTFDTLNDYLSSAHTTVMLCRANADTFMASHDQALDIDHKINLYISELEDLRQKITESVHALEVSKKYCRQDSTLFQNT